MTGGHVHMRKRNMTSRVSRDSPVHLAPFASFSCSNIQHPNETNFIFCYPFPVLHVNRILIGRRQLEHHDGSGQPTIHETAISPAIGENHGYGEQSFLPSSFTFLVELRPVLPPDRIN